MTMAWSQEAKSDAKEKGLALVKAYVQAKHVEGDAGVAGGSIEVAIAMHAERAWQLVDIVTRSVRGVEVPEREPGDRAGRKSDVATELLDSVVRAHERLKSVGDVAEDDDGAELLYLLVAAWVDRVADAGLLARHTHHLDTIERSLVELSARVVYEKRKHPFVPYHDPLGGPCVCPQCEAARAG